MAWTTEPYATLEQVKTALDLVGTAKDPWLLELIGEAQDLLDEKIGFKHQQDGTVGTPAVRVYSGKGGPDLWINDCIQVTQVLEIIRSPAASTTDITTNILLGPDNAMPGYKLYKADGECFDKGIQNYKVYGIFGQPEIPPRLTRACLRLVTHWYGMMSTFYADGLSEQGGVRLSYKKNIPDDVMEIIESFRRTMFLSR